MLETLGKIGARLTQYFGDPEIGSLEKEPLLSSLPLAKLLPYEAYEEESGLFVNAHSLGFVIEAVPLVGGDHALQQVLETLFNELLEEGASIQCLLFADHRIDPFLQAWEEGRGLSSDILKQFVAKRAEFFRTAAHISPRLFRFIFSYSQAAESALLKEKKAKILETLKAFTYATAWKAEHLLEFVGGIANFSLSKSIQKRTWNPYQTLSSQMTTGGKIAVHEDRLEWKTDTETAFKSYRAIEYPTFWNFSQMQSLIGDVFREAFRVPTPFFLHYGIHCPKQGKAEGNFWRRAHLVENQGRSNTLLRWIPELEKELKEYDYVRRALAQGSRFVWTQFSAGIWAEKEKLPQAEQILKGLFKINQFTLAENRCVHLPHLIASLPMTWAEHVHDLQNLQMLRTTITDECVNFLPMQGEWMGTPTPCMLMMGRRGQLLNWNPFDNKTGNYNVVVAGRSGSGKSVFMQDFLFNALSIGAKVFVLEVGRSFEKMGELLNSQQIEFSKDSQICLNPFSGFSSQDADVLDTSISFLKSIISCMAAPSEGTSDFENSLIERAIRFAWDKKSTEATITDVANWLHAHEDPRAQTLGTMLTPYTKEGVYARHFEGKNNVNFNQSMVLVELEELKEKKDLQSVVLQLFIMAITNQAFLGDRKTPFVICIDEAWDLLRSKQAGPFIETLARRLRKYRGSLVIGTQGIEDFFATPGSKAAFENSDWMCLFAQAKSSIATLAESGKLDLSEAKRQALESVSTRQGQYSELMICDAEGNYSIARLVIDFFSQLLYTTKAEEFAKIKDLTKKGYSIAEAIEVLLVERKRDV